MGIPKTSFHPPLVTKPLTITFKHLSPSLWTRFSLLLSTWPWTIGHNLLCSPTTTPSHLYNPLPLHVSSSHCCRDSSNTFLLCSFLTCVLHLFMESNRTIPTSNTITTSTPTTSTSPNQGQNTSNQIGLLLPLLPVASLYSSSNHPFFPPEGQTFSLPSHPHQGLHYQQNETQSCPLAFSSDYFGPSMLPVFPLMVDQNSAAPNPVVGGVFEGVSPNTHQPLKWDSSISKAARNKRKMAMRMSSSSSASRTSLSSSSSRSTSRTPIITTATENDNNKDVYNFTTPDGKKLKFVLQKELKNSDIGSLGRIVLPKKPSEENLPNLSVKEGIQVTVREVESTKVWEMRYRYWPNNKSRMYILENTGKYVRQNELKTGDYVMIYKDEENQLYISCKKAETSTSVPVNDEAQRGVERLQHSTSSEGNINEFSYSVSSPVVAEDTWTEQATELDQPSCTNDIVMDGSNALALEDSYLMDAQEGYDFREYDRLLDFNDCDFSLFDDDQLLKDNHGDDKDDEDKGGNNVGVPK